MFAEEKPGSPQELLHYGVKGMKWGKRKAVVKTARANVREKKRQVRAKKEAGEISKNQAKAETKAIRQSKEAHVARNMTRGNQVATSILLGPVGLVGNIAYTQINKASARLNSHEDSTRKK